MLLIVWIIFDLLLFYRNHTFYLLVFEAEFGLEHVYDLIIAGVEDLLRLLSCHVHEMEILFVIMSWYL